MPETISTTLQRKTVALAASQGDENLPEKYYWKAAEYIGIGLADMGESF